MLWFLPYILSLPITDAMGLSDQCQTNLFSIDRRVGYSFVRAAAVIMSSEVKNCDL